jgi:hypothetical protein
VSQSRFIYLFILDTSDGDECPLTCAVFIQAPQLLMLEISEKNILCRPENAFALDGESVMTGFRAGLRQISRKSRAGAAHFFNAIKQIFIRRNLTGAHQFY